LPGKNKTTIIAATPRKGLIGLKDVAGQLSVGEIAKIKSEASLIGRSAATMSSFVSSEIARKGDLVYYKDGEVAKFGKVLSDDKVLIYNNGLMDRIVLSINDLPTAVFFTNRDISSNYALFTIRANN
jgi:hypothetical protein